MLGILVWQEGGEAVGALIAVGVRWRWRGSSCWLRRRKRAGKPTLLDPDLFTSQLLQARRHRADAPADRARRHDDRAADLPADGARVRRDGGRPVARAAVAQHVRDRAAGREEGREPAARAASSGSASRSSRSASPCCSPIVPRADSGWALAIPLVIAGCGLGLLVSQLNNYTLSPISDERVSEAAGVNSAAGSFGLSFGLAFAGAIMLATLSIAFTNKAEASDVLPAAEQGAGGAGPRGRRRGDEQHAARGAARRASPRRSRTRSSASTPTRGRSRFRSRC